MHHLENVHANPGAISSNGCWQIGSMKPTGWTSGRGGGLKHRRDSSYGEQDGPRTVVSADLQNVELLESSSGSDAPGRSTEQLWANSPDFTVITSGLLTAAGAGWVCYLK